MATVLQQRGRFSAIDIVHRLSQQDRQQYLLSGFIRDAFKTLVPKEIKCIILEYAKLDIQSDLEIELNKRIKVAIIGPGAVGKSAITIRLVANEFRQEYDPTIEDYYHCTIDVDGYQRKLNILDIQSMNDM